MPRATQSHRPHHRQDFLQQARRGAVAMAVDEQAPPAWQRRMAPGKLQRSARPNHPVPLLRGTDPPYRHSIFQSWPWEVSNGLSWRQHDGVQQHLVTYNMEIIRYVRTYTVRSCGKKTEARSCLSQNLLRNQWLRSTYV